MSSFLALIPMTNQQLFKHFKNIPAKSWFCQSDNQVSKLFSNQPSKQARKPITQQPSKQASAIRQASKQAHQTSNQAQTEALSLFRVCCLRSKPAWQSSQASQRKSTNHQRRPAKQLPMTYGRSSASSLLGGWKPRFPDDFQETKLKLATISEERGQMPCLPI